MAQQRHPPGLYVLFATEMWERFGFYTMVSMFALYLQDKEQGFGWSDKDATTLYANYMMFVYASPLIGGWIADRGLGYRRSVMIGGAVFMAGYLLMAVHSLPMVYLALCCLVVGNAFFKPNVSAMVGNLYEEGSPLKDRAYSIFYMGINFGALLAPLVAEFVHKRIGFHAGFANAALGLLISVAILQIFKNHVEKRPNGIPKADAVTEPSPAANPLPIDKISDGKRVAVLILIFLIVIVFWMVFHQNGTTITYWAKDNTDWKFSGVISNAINPFWVVTLTLPLVSLWRWLNSKGMEPSTPTKMALGMFLTSLAFLILFMAAKIGESGAPSESPRDFRVSPAWLLGAYAVLTLAELMLSPMGLSLVSKVAPRRFRGLMMGGWFLATAIGNKLTQIGILWNEWLHSTFWIVLGGLALTMAILLLILLKPLKKAMPGV